MSKPNHPKFSGTARNIHQQANQLYSLLPVHKDGAIRPYVSTPRKLSKAEQRWHGLTEDGVPAALAAEGLD